MNTPNAQLLSDLYLLCEENETGTFFITTNENRSCQVVLKEGEIISMSFGRIMGDEVLALIQDMQVERFSFKLGSLLPMPVEAQVSSSKTFLQELAHRQTEMMTAFQT